MRAALRDAAGRLASYATGGSFLNFLADPAATRSAYTPADHRRLTGIKRTYDPGNFFHRNHNIPPPPAGQQPAGGE